VIFTWELPVAIVGGAVAGGAVFLMVRELMPATPSLGPTLARLQPDIDAPARQRMENALGTWGWLAKYVTPPASDLAILGKGTDEYLTSLAVSAIVGLIAPTVFVILLALIGLSLHIVVSLLLGPIFGALFALFAHRSVVHKGEIARRDFSRTFCTYLDLVILELTAAGPVQALERAAKICHGWVFERIDEALVEAEMQLTFPWDQLRILGEQIGVIELQDFAAIMRSAGDSGAHVQSTLHEQAESLRDRQRTDALTRAESVSARLEMPAAMLVIVLAIFMIYPLMARLGK
jgi:Flp pilus assembly protein TadB